MDGLDSNIRKLEANFHRELSNSCRKHIKKLGVVSVLGMLEMVKQETIELERATRSEV